MTSSADRASPFATPSTGRRILHKFASPFGQKARSISEFTVKAHDPHKQYSPGEKVTGAVVVKVVKPIRLTHISVCLHGFVQVHKTPGLPAESNRGYSSRIGRAQGKKSGEYFGNGFASLFEDESVLCGEGRLAEGSYRFDFEVTFPKDIDLPSSIEFERGTISYMITATLTRPTTMNPILSHDQRLFLCERIDIANLLPPKPRTITLEPVPRRSRPKGQLKRPTLDSQGRAGTSSVSARTQESVQSSPLNAVVQTDALPRTPSISEASVDSRPSSNLRRLSASGSGFLSQRTSDSFNGLSTVTSVSDKTITATVESLKGGCLRGDSIPIKIMVSHTKHIKSMNGVIITLYRLARVDLHPALPLGPMTDGQKRKYEDYYPKSRTGLGGLSLSGTGTSHVFRKDLAQTLVPMIVDPQTLKAEISARVMVPDDAFPTINTVPGAMISFRYYIEVVLDIQGKLAGSDKFFSQIGGNNIYGGKLGSSTDTNGSTGLLNTSSFQLQGPGILDTTPIRRDKSVVTSVFEVVVGTLDSDRKKGKARARTPPEDENIIETAHLAPVSAATPRSAIIHSPLNQPPPQEEEPHPGWYEWGSHPQTDWPDYSEGYHNGGYEEYPPYDVEQYHYHNEYNTMPHYIHPPPIANEDEIPEKERLRRAEARLMPSQPPGLEQATHLDCAVPSVPVLFEEHFRPVDDMAAAGSSRTSAGPGHRDQHIQDGIALPSEQSPSTWLEGPALLGAEVPSSEPIIQSEFQADDKQELHRRQLQLTASAPPTMADAVSVSAGGAGPSAPCLPSDMDVPLEDHDLLHRGNGVEHLPQYYR